MNGAVPTISLPALFRMMPEFRRDALGTFASLARNHGDVVRLTGFWTSYLLSNPVHIEHVLQTNSRNYRKGRVYKELIPSTGEGLFVSDGDVWRRQRRLAQPAFHREWIASFARIMTDATEEMLARWSRVSDTGKPLRVDEEMTRLTLGIVTRSLLSRDLSCEAETVSRSFDVIREHTMRRLTSFIKLPQSLPFPRNRRFRKAVAEADRIVYGVIGERRRSEDVDDLLSMLMAARDEETGEGLSDRELRDQALTIIGAGYETTTQALTWMWYLLARHPEVEARLHTELDEVLCGRSPEFDDLPRLPYTLMIFQEAMRLYPPAWMLSRTAIADDEVDGLRIPAGAEVLILTYVTQRRPDHWLDPETFDPENFSSHRSKERHRFAYLPFGGGPRQCIGNNFALMEAQLITAAVGQRYRLRLLNDREILPEPSVTLRPKGGMPMIVVPRLADN